MLWFSVDKVAKVSTEAHSFAIEMALGSFVLESTLRTVFAVAL